MKDHTKKKNIERHATITVIEKNWFLGQINNYGLVVIT